MAKAYVNFSVSNDVVAKTYEALQLAKQSGTIRKGANEVTKSIERGLATFVVIAEDVDPEEVVIHIPKMCDAKKIPYSYAPTKMELGKSIGLTVPCTAIAVEKQGNSSNAIKEVVSKITGKSQSSSAEPKAEKKAEAPKAAPKPKTEKKAEKPAEKHAEKPAEAPAA